jgi:2-iminoacetate synthase
MNDASDDRDDDVADAVAVAVQADAREVAAALNCDRPGERELAVLLSSAAGREMERLAARAQALTRRHFGRTMALYVPLYLSNYCSGGCAYCGFAADRSHPRVKLSFAEIEAEITALHSMGFEDVLLLTGEETPEADFAYLREAVEIAARHCHRIGVECFAMSRERYEELFRAGCTAVTLYQETYHRGVYRQMHRWGAKRDYDFRVQAPGRALAAGARAFGMGVLLGLADPVQEALCLFRHLAALRQRYWQAEYSLSFPRIRAQAGGFQAPHPVDDRLLAQMIFAFRICLPTVPLVLSTRESASFRDGMAGLGVSRMSVASRTTVGGYSRPERHEGQGQFSVCDTRDTASFCAALRARSLQPVFKNWDATLR